MNKTKYKIEDICCVVVTYNGSYETIETLLNYEKIFDELIVIDNNSSLEFKKLLTDNIKHANLVFNRENEGIAKALNQGFIYAKDRGSRFLLTMDQDSVMTKEIAVELLNAIDEKEKYISVGPSYKDGNKQDFIDANFLITSGNLVLIDAIEKVSGYPEELFIDEVDIDFSWALLSAGYKLRQLGKVIMQHKIGEYEKSKLFRIQYLSHSPIRFYYIYRNTILVFKKYYKKYKRKCIKMVLALLFVDTWQLLLLENHKIEKLTMAIKGVNDGMRNINGKYQKI